MRSARALAVLAALAAQPLAIACGEPRTFSGALDAVVVSSNEPATIGVFVTGFDNNCGIESFTCSPPFVRNNGTVAIDVHGDDGAARSAAGTVTCSVHPAAGLAAVGPRRVVGVGADGRLDLPFRVSRGEILGVVAWVDRDNDLALAPDEPCVAAFRREHEDRGRDGAPQLTPLLVLEQTLGVVGAGSGPPFSDSLVDDYADEWFFPLDKVSPAGNIDVENL